VQSRRQHEVAETTAIAEFRSDSDDRPDREILNRDISIR
jgi:hypothetical protein